MKKNVLIAVLSLAILVLLYLLFDKEKIKQPESLADLNTFLSTNYLQEVSNRDSLYRKAKSFLEDRSKFEVYVAQLMAAPPLRYIDIETANCYFKLYHDRKLTISSSTDATIKALKVEEDKTDAISIPLDTFLQKVAIHYINDIDFNNPDTWKDKRFFVYPVHYGMNGYSQGTTTGINKYMSSVILQFAKKSSTPDKWKMIDNSTYNFGDLKPPKVCAEGEYLTGTISTPCQ